MKVNLILEKQRILKEKFNRLENEVYNNSNSMTEKDFVEVSNNLN